jgi:hypothetical protein
MMTGWSEQCFGPFLNWMRAAMRKTYNANVLAQSSAELQTLAPKPFG